jgi:hypothetical protein
VALHLCRLTIGVVGEPTGWVTFFCTGPATTVADILGGIDDGPGLSVRAVGAA